MKVLIVSTSDISGGAARAAYRLHHALLSEGVDSCMLVQSKATDEWRVISADTKMQKILNKLRPIFDAMPVKRYKHRSATLFSPAFVPFSAILSQIAAIQPDIVHLHWICGGMIPIEDLAKIPVPIVWNQQDMWGFTGGCHYDENCGAYKLQCGHCKVLGSHIEQDLSRRVLKRKLATFSQMDRLTIVGVSRWISDCARESAVFKDKPVVTLPNAIDTQLFKPMDKAMARDLFHIPKDKKIILFGAMSSLSDPRKGAAQLFDALNRLHSDNVELVIAGSSRPKNEPSLRYPAHYIAPLHDEVSLPLMYTLADVVIVPSIQENLANAIIESLACGVPVVAFDIGGNRDMIDHQQNGYLATSFDATDMAHGIDWVLNHENGASLSQCARQKALTTFDRHVVATQYIDLYSQILEKQP